MSPFYCLHLTNDQRHSRTGSKLRSRIGDIVRHSVGKVTPWGRSLRGEGHSVGKSCPARSLLRRPRRPELGLMLLTAQVARGSVGSPNVMVGDRLELDACDLELVCTLYLVPSTFEVSAQSMGYGSLFASARSESSIRLNWKRPSDIRSLRSVDNWTGSGN